MESAVSLRKEKYTGEIFGGSRCGEMAISDNQELWTLKETESRFDEFDAPSVLSTQMERRVWVSGHGNCAKWVPESWIEPLEMKRQ